MPVHPFEVAHLYDGDVKGVGGHIVEGEDGQRRFHISIWPDGVVPYVLTGPFSIIYSCIIIYISS